MPEEGLDPRHADYDLLAAQDRRAEVAGGQRDVLAVVVGVDDELAAQAIERLGEVGVAAGRVMSMSSVRGAGGGSAARRRR